MKVLIVASGNNNNIRPFILDQVEALKKKAIEIEYFLIKGTGIFGYIKNFKLLLEKIIIYEPKIIHAHYGLSGLLCVLQRKVPVIVTFHGSDINSLKVRYFSKIANELSSKSIFVSKKLADKLKQNNPIVIPCGVDFNLFYPINKKKARMQLGLSQDKKYILFSSSFSIPIKNYPLAKKAISILSDENVNLIELEGYKRGEVATIMNAVDTVLMTSFSEGSPQIIKEAMACNIPIVSTDVGDVRELISSTEGCYIASYDPEDVAKNILNAINYNRTNGRNMIKHWDNDKIAELIVNLYKDTF